VLLGQIFIWQLSLREICRILDSKAIKHLQANATKMTDYFVHPTAIVDEGCRIGKGTKIWYFTHVQSGTEIGEHCSLGQNVNVGNNVRIGNHVKIQNNVSVYEGVTLEDFVFCGPSMVFTNVINPRCEYPQRGSQYYAKTLVKYGASIGANATIVCGKTIGRFAFIGAGTVVTRDVPDYALVLGNPGRLAGYVCRCGERLRLISGSGKCAKCSREYQMDADRLSCTREVVDR
jgi:UDP-2-acetamido-3-amino-2,3-dideoxy-glucuronate N-acetyltransferase